MKRWTATNNGHCEKCQKPVKHMSSPIGEWVDASDAMALQEERDELKLVVDILAKRVLSEELNIEEASTDFNGNKSYVPDRTADIIILKARAKAREQS